MSMTLYQLSGQYKQLAEQLSNLDLDAQTVADTIEASGLVDSLQDKAQGVLLVAKSAEIYIPAIDAEIERLQALKAKHQKVAQGVRDYLKLNMEQAGIDKIECPLFQITIRKNPPAVDVFDDKQIPAEYWVTPEPKPPVAAISKTLLSKAIKAGAEVPGARLVQGTKLVVA